VYSDRQPLIPVLQCLKPLPRRGKAGLVVGKAKSDKLGSEDFPLITEEDTLEGGTGHYEVIIVFSKSIGSPVNGSIE